MAAVHETIQTVKSVDVDAYKYGFVTDIESDKAPKGLSEDIVRFISARKNEPEWMLEWRLDAYRRWLDHDGARLGRGSIIQRSTIRISIITRRRRSMSGPQSLDEVDPATAAHL